MYGNEIQNPCCIVCSDIGTQKVKSIFVLKNNLFLSSHKAVWSLLRINLVCFLCTPPISSRSHYVVTGQWRCGDLQNHVSVAPWFLHRDCVLFRPIGSRGCGVAMHLQICQRYTFLCVFQHAEKHTKLRKSSFGIYILPLTFLHVGIHSS